MSMSAIGPLFRRSRYGFRRIAGNSQHSVAGPFDQIVEVPRDEHLVFDDQDEGRNDTADWSGKATCTA
jgi:hypothetical protein